MASMFEAVAREIEVTQGVNEALMRFCRLMSHTLPVEGAFIGKHFPDSREVLFIAQANLNDSRSLHINVPVSDDVQHYLISKNRPEARSYFLDSFPSMLNLNKSVIPIHNRGYMEIRLRAGDRHIGMLGLYSKHGTSFNHQNEKLLLDVRKPIAQTLAMHLLKKGLLHLPDKLPLFLENVQSCAEMAPTASIAMRRVLQKICIAAPLSHTVLLLGETGVGKEVLARRLHAHSKRSSGPFIHVNCGALPETLVDSELFGYEKGAFTGADSRHIGFFEQANGGTIFLDEIAELPSSLQARLLLTLQDKTICRVGGRQRIPLDIRVVAATNRNLHEMVSARLFRKDLLYRLNALTIEIPALRDRREDIPMLATYFAENTARSLGMLQAPVLPDELLCQWMHYHWPGNIRELSNQVEQMLIFGLSGLRFETERDGDIYLEQKCIRDQTQTLTETASLQQYTKTHIQKVLEQTQGRVAGAGAAAEILQVHPSTLRSRMKKMGIPYGRRYLNVRN